MTSGYQLSKLLNKMNIYNFDIIRLRDFNKTKNDNVIINLDNFGKGSHWVYYSKKYHYYFDTYNQPAPEEIPKEYKHGKFIIEGINQDECGYLCCLFCYYINKYGNDKKFYNLFTKLYSP